jgi:hypothetical protein
VVLDLLIPSLLLLALARLSLAIRRQGLASLGLRRVHGVGGVTHVIVLVLCPAID